MGTRTKTIMTAAALGAVGLALHGCAGGGPQPALVAGSAAPADTLIAAAPPPTVPVGLDTAFVVAMDSAFGAVMDRDSLTTLTAATRELDLSEEAVDTLGAVTRFVQLAATGDERWAMSPADSQVVGSLVLRGRAADDPDAARMLDLDRALGEITRLAARADSLQGDLAWAGTDPARAGQAREVRLAVLGFGSESAELRDRLLDLQSELGPASLTADSARTQQAVGELVRAFGADLDRTINTMGRAAQNVTAGTLTPATMRGLQSALLEQRSALLGFESRWAQFDGTASLDLANPDQPFNPARMGKLLDRMTEDLRYLAQMAANRAAELDTARGFEGELAARRAAEQTLDKTRTALVEMKRRNRSLVSSYGKLAASYWRGRLDAVAAEQQEREDLYGQLDGMLRRAGGAEAIRDDAGLLAAYRAASDRLLDLRRRHLDKVAHHDRLRQSVQASLATDLFNRARVLGAEDDYVAAREAYADLRAEQPGEYPWAYQLASLAWYESREPWCADADGARSLGSQHLAECETILLARHAYDQDMDEAAAGLAAAAGETARAAPDTLPPLPSARAALFAPSDPQWHYASAVTRAAADLAALEPAAAAADVRRWLLNIDVLRKRLAFDAGRGDEFLYRYARQALLDGDLDAAQARPVLEHWSWDAGNIDLRRRWTAAARLPDSTLVQAAAKRDTLAGVLQAARTTGARRRVAWTVAALDFQQLGRHDEGLQRMHDLLAEVEGMPTVEPEAGAIDSLVVTGYPVYLYNRGTAYQVEGRRQEAFYCFLGVSEQYARDRRTAALARFSAASLLADGNRKGALTLVRSAIADALAEVSADPRAIDIETLVAMHDLRRELAGELGLFQEATRARDEARQLAALSERQAAVEVSP